jgi:hypothetical protein
MRSRSNRVAATKFINGIAQALAHHGRAAELLATSKKREETTDGKQ